MSVLVPAFNACRYLPKSLDSVLAQTYDAFEVVVVDDASTDETPAIASCYVGDRVRWHRNEQNLGQFGTLNVALSLARGDMIAIQHADDVYLPLLLEREVEFLKQHPRAGAAFSLDFFIDPSGREWGRAEPPAEFRGGVVLEYADVLNGILRYGNVFIRGGTSLVRREVYDAVGPFDGSFALRGDLDMWLRIARFCPIGILDEHLTQYRWGHDHLSARRWS